MRPDTALIATPRTDRLLRMRRLLAPLAMPVVSPDPNALPVYAASIRARLAVIDVDGLRDRDGDPTRVAESLAARVRAGSPETALALIVPSASPDVEIGLMLAGFAAVCRHDTSDAVMTRILRATLRGEVCVRRELVATLVRHAARGRVAEYGAGPNRGSIPRPPFGSEAPTRGLAALGRLTPREADIARAVGAGQPNKSIAFALGITERTVKAHLTEIFRKLGISDRLQLALIVATRGGSHGTARTEFEPTPL